jgi:fibronectin type 3 domain-containing protein
VTGYHVYRVAGTGTPVRFNSLAGTTLDFADNAVGGGTTYSYFVKSVDASGLESVS